MPEWWSTSEPAAAGGARLANASGGPPQSADTGWITGQSVLQGRCSALCCSNFWRYAHVWSPCRNDFPADCNLRCSSLTPCCVGLDQGVHTKALYLTDASLRMQHRTRQANSYEVGARLHQRSLHGSCLVLILTYTVA